MGYPRAMTVDSEAPGFYHCISRCVRRAWLCGEDPYTGKNYDHRRKWIEQRLLYLSESFSVGLYAWAVMSNHTHVVLRVDPSLTESWTDQEVAWRWARLTRSLLPMSDSDLVTRMRSLTGNPARVDELRKRLGSVSWFMRYLNEAIARAANAEDECSGRFWEGRFRCQALLDDEAVLACMAYVDLNPIRAGVADDLASSEFTSVHRRLSSPDGPESTGEAVLRPLAGGADQEAMPTSVAGYFELVEWTGRVSRMARPDIAHLREPPPSTLAQLRGSPGWWIGSAMRIEEAFGSAVGSPHQLRHFVQRTGRQRVRGL